MAIQNGVNRASKLGQEKNYIPQQLCLEVLLTLPPIVKTSSLILHDLILT